MGKAVTKKGFVVDKAAFWPSAIVTLAIGALCVLFPDWFISMANSVLSGVLSNFTWFIMAMSTLVTLTLIYVAFTPLGKKIVGGPDAEKVYKSDFTWFFVILCASIGIAIVFWAVYEPLGLFMKLPEFALSLGVVPGSNGAALFAIAETTWHWCGPYYGVQMIWGLAIVYLSLNKGLPFRPSSALYPVLGNRIFGNVGKSIDVMCIVAQLFGAITCLGLAAIQVAACCGFIIPGFATDSIAIQIGIVCLAGIIVVLSSTSGMKKGIAYLSDFNAYIYIVLLVFLVLAGPTVRLLEGIVGSVAEAIRILPNSWLNSDLLGTDGGYVNGYASYYYVWALVFGPVGGSFYAKACLGRTYRQFILGILSGSFIFLIVWFVAWGGNAIYLQSQLGIDIWSTVTAKGLESSNWALLSHMPLPKLTIPLAAFCAFIGFVTLAQAIIAAIASITTKHSREMDAPISVTLFWGVIMTVVTIILLGAVAKTGLSALQAAAVAFGLVVMVITVFVMMGYFKMATGEVDKILESTPEGKKTYEIIAKMETESENL